LKKAAARQLLAPAAAQQPLRKLRRFIVGRTPAVIRIIETMARNAPGCNGAEIATRPVAIGRVAHDVQRGVCSGILAQEIDQR
jgi:hypothetical protein